MKLETKKAEFSKLVDRFISNPKITKAAIHKMIQIIDKEVKRYEKNLISKWGSL